MQVGELEAVIFIGHGNRSPKGSLEFVKFIKRTLRDVIVPIKEYCFYERAEPTLQEAFENCVKRGATSICVVPVLLLPGKQTTVEIPSELRRLQEMFPEVHLKWGNPIGADPVIINIINKRLVNKSFEGLKNEAVLLVSHGSDDPLAYNEFKKMAQVISSQLNVKVETGFIVTNPLFKDIVEKLLKDGYNKIYMVPYFLFAGTFLQELHEASHANDHLFLCDEIGYDEGLMQMLASRVELTKREYV